MPHGLELPIESREEGVTVAYNEATGKKISTSKAGQKRYFRYGESNPGLAGLMLCLRAADASHYTITDSLILIRSNKRYLFIVFRSW